MAWEKNIKIETGKFTAWCKKAGFSGPTISCIKKALSSAKKMGGERGKSLRGMALFALRAKKGWRKKGLTKKI